MSDERWTMVERLCNAALEQPAGDRDVWLRAACGTDTGLYGEVASLLKYGELAADFLRVPALQSMAASLSKEIELVPGSALGQYEICELIGSGGMGDVYRARDTRLRRDVAIKVLPLLLTTDQDRVARFEREAQVLAAVNHPHIATIYGFERRVRPTSNPGRRTPTAGMMPALVMELVEGPTLADRIRRGPIPLAEAQPIAGQIAEALEAAHERGIIHRDLKPSNIKLTTDDAVKVVDFGLATVFSAARETGTPTSRSTTEEETRTELVAGTSAYMSPEQARGRPVDKRSDIWAFGCVVYEMLTGRRAFPGDQPADVRAALLQGSVDWGSLPPSTPAHVRWMLQRCLQRDPRQRLRDIGDARLLLAADITGREQTAGRNGRRRFSALAAALTLIVIALLVSTLASLDVRPLAPRIVDISETATASRPAISPDALSVAYAAPDGLWVRRLDKEAPSRIIAASDIGSITWSADSDLLAYFRGEKVHLVRRDGTEDRIVWRPSARIRWSRSDVGLAWSRRALYLPVQIAQGVPAIAQVPLDGGEPAVIRPSQSARSMVIFRHPVVVEPATVLVNPGVRNEAGIDFGTVWALRGSEAKHVLSFPDTGIVGMAYLADARVLLVATDDGNRRALWASPFDAASLTAGQPVPIADGFSPSAPSARGDIVLVTGVRPRVPLFRRFTDSGREIATAVQRRLDVRNPELAPDGRRIAYRARTTLGAPTGLWVYDIGRGIETFVAPVQGSGLATWSPDGRRLALTQQSDADGALDLVDVDAGQTRRLVAGGVRGKPTWTTDNRVLYIGGPDSAPEIRSISADFPGAQGEMVASIPSLLRIALSPDGRILAYSDGPPQRAAVTVAPFPAMAPRVQVSAEGVEYFLWSPHSDALWLVSQNAIVSVPIAMNGARKLTSGAPRPIFVPPPGLTLLHSMRGRQFTTLDGKQFWMVDQRLEGVPRVTLIENVERLVRRASTP
jgi:serine/threonine protein kinase